MSQKEGKTINRSDLSRRDFHKLTVAAFGGILGGSLVMRNASAGEESLLLKEPHVCCGLNTCKGQGAGGENACGGAGNCATAEHHSCNGQNVCKGQGGCGSNPGENGCKGQGKCAVPLKHTWKEARANFEAAMKKAGRDVGPAPENCGK